MDEKGLKTFLTWDIIFNIVLIITTYIFLRFGPDMGRSEGIIWSMVLALSFMFSFLCLIGRVLWRQELGNSES